MNNIKQSKFNFNDYKVGDVLVVYGGRGLISRLIAKLTYRGTGYWSHTGLISAIGNEIKMVIHASDDGVCFTSLKNFLKNRKSLAVVRCNKPFNTKKLIEDSMLFYGVPYAWKQLKWDLLACIWKLGKGREVIKQFKRDENGMICTELIAKLYENQGIKVKSKEEDGIYIPPQFLAPNEFIDSFNFDIIYYSGK